MSGKVLGPGIYFNAGNNSRINQDFEKRSAVLLLLADRFVIKNRATDALAETGCGHNQLPIGAPGLHCLRNSQRGEALVAGGITFIHRQQSLVVGEQLFCGIDQKFCVHSQVLFQGVDTVVSNETSQPPPSALINWTLAVSCSIWRFSAVH